MPTRISVKSGTTSAGQTSPPGASAIRRWARTRDAVAGGAIPAQTHEVAQRPGGRAVEHHPGIVERRIGFARWIDAPRIVGQMLGGIPASPRQVDAAAECQAFVDHDHLLVMAAADRQDVVEAKLDLLRRIPEAGVVGHQIALEDVEQRVIPEQQANLELGTTFDQRGEEWAELFRQAVGRAAGPVERRFAVQVPADDVDGVLGGEHRGARGGKIGCCVDQRGNPPRRLGAPDIAPRLQERFRRRRWATESKSIGEHGRPVPLVSQAQRITSGNDPRSNSASPPGEGLLPSAFGIIPEVPRR